ncbi:hypothetical protein MMC16_000092 [Acarospora aff. strigata]|nr:hypothetical protein [Acarospora aff. strigata]
MIDASNLDWRLHLSGAASLVSTHGWHSCSGGLEQACFWIYCRMDVLSSLATSEPTRLDTSVWFPPDRALALRDGSNPWNFDTWSNYVVLLLAQVHNFLCKIRREGLATPTLLEEWYVLQERIVAHRRRQPALFQPLAVLPADVNNKENPFTSRRYLTDKVCAAIQMFSLANLFLLLARPEYSRHERVARFAAQANIAKDLVDRVVANSIVNRREIPRVNAVQLLTSAGLAIVGWVERKALLKILDDIHIQTGWNTQGNSDGLLEWWGWSTLLRDRGQTWRDVQGEVGPPKSTDDFLMMMFEIKK